MQYRFNNRNVEVSCKVTGASKCDGKPFTFVPSGFDHQTISKGDTVNNEHAPQATTPAVTLKANCRDQNPPSLFPTRPTVFGLVTCDPCTRVDAKVRTAPIVGFVP
eukprot:2186122-Pyramimonas_sp.AAC.1